MTKEKAFTLIELLLVIAIIGILSTIMIVSVRLAIEKTHNTRVKAEIKNIALALEFFLIDNNCKEPCDVNRDMPPGIENYLAGQEWTKAPWPGTVYDWEYWHPNPPSTGPNPSGSGYCAGNLSYSPGEPVYQLSIRCDWIDGECNFPDKEWSKGFNSDSSVYWCFSGPCRAHGSRPYNHPGCCIGGNCPPDQPNCGI